MSCTMCNYREADQKMDGMYFMREGLETEHMGLTAIELEPGWEGPEHEHADEGHEEVYMCVDGEATMTVDGQAYELGPGDAMRVSPEATRQIHGETSGMMVVAGAP